MKSVFDVLVGSYLFAPIGGPGEVEPDIHLKVGSNVWDDVGSSSERRHMEGVRRGAL